VCCAAVCVGTGLKEAVTLLEGMLNDNTDFVRQGASIAMALVLLQQPESVVEPFRKKVRHTGCVFGSQTCSPRHLDRIAQHACCVYPGAGCVVGFSGVLFLSVYACQQCGCCLRLRICRQQVRACCNGRLSKIWVASLLLCCVVYVPCCS